MNFIKRYLPFLRLLVFPALAALSGCNPVAEICDWTQGCDSPASAPSVPVNTAGTFSYYQITDFTNPDLSSLCVIEGQVCYNEVADNFAVDLEFYKWQPKNGYSVYASNGDGSAPNIPLSATTIIDDTANLAYISSHGGIVNGNEGQICLYYCNGQFGNQYGFGPSDIPNPWNGPNWLILDSCDAVVPNVGWEGLFGGSLHGILGWNTNIDLNMQPAQDTRFANDVGGFNTALRDWEDVATSELMMPSLAALIPQANASDAIVSSGSPNFGYSGDTSPQYYSVNSSGQVTTQNVSTLSGAPTSAVSLMPEVMDESYWEDYYGGSSTPSVVSHPSSNEDLYRSPSVMVDHYLASGGLFVTSAASGTARGFSNSEAYQYALSWIASNGGLPSDAALTYAGQETVTPNSTPATSTEPAPSVRQYVFIWRHANSGLLANDGIEINVDDVGHLTATTTTKVVTVEYPNPHCGCNQPIQVTETVVTYGLPWVPVYNVNAYSRMWRGLGGEVSSLPGTRSTALTTTCPTLGPIGGTNAATTCINPDPLPTTPIHIGSPSAAPSAVPTITATSIPPPYAYAYCGSDMSVTPSVAQPCGIVNTGPNTTYTVNNVAVASSERL